MPARPPLGFLLLDDSLAPIFVDAAVRAALIGESESDMDFDGGLAQFKSTVEPLIRGGQLRSEFEFAGGRWRWSAFSCGCCHGGPQTLHAFVLGPATEVRYVTAIASIYRLTPREAEALERYLAGLTVKEVGAQMQISPSTAKTFLRSICGKMGVTSRSELMSRVLNFSCSASFDCPFRIALNPVRVNPDY